MARIIKNTLLTLTAPNGISLVFGEGQQFDLDRITGLGLGEIEKKLSSNVLQDGSILTSMRMLSRKLTICTSWSTSAQRKILTEFLQPFWRYQAKITFDDKNYFGTCVLDEAYQYEEHGGNLYSGSSTEISLLFPDPYLYTDILYQYDIGYGQENCFNFATTMAQFTQAYPPQKPIVISIIQGAPSYTITNTSNVINGVQVEITALEAIKKPKLINSTTGRVMQFMVNMSPNDVMKINTQLGNISATLNGKDVLATLGMHSRMLEVVPGKNIISFSAEEGTQLAKVVLSFRGRVSAI